MPEGLTELSHGGMHLGEKLVARHIQLVLPACPAASSLFYRENEPTRPRAGPSQPSRRELVGHQAQTQQDCFGGDCHGPGCINKP